MCGMKQLYRLLMVVAVGSSGLLAFAGDKKTRDAGPAIGFISCISDAANARTFDNACTSSPTGEIACGEQVEIVRREGAFFIVKAKDREAYVPAVSVSASAKKFVPMSVDVPSSEPDCASVWATKMANVPGKQQPRILYSPDPEYPENARKAKVQGTVQLSFTVGTDGRAHDVQVKKGLGHGLDEAAIAAVEKWKFLPGMQDGKPVDTTISVEVNFRMYK